MSDHTPSPEGNDPAPAPRRQTVRPPGVTGPEDPSSGPREADQLTEVAHELRNMLDGSMRWLGLAAAVLPEGDLDDDEGKLRAAREQILLVQGTLERMSSMVSAALRTPGVSVHSPLLGVSDAVSLGMAIDHAADVVRPLARERGVQISIDIRPESGCVPAGAMYTVVLNALMNAVQSIGRAAERDPLNPGGVVEIRAHADAVAGEAVIDVIDDGQGVDPSVRGGAAFDHGVTTRDDGFGIGLAISRQIVLAMHGSITLGEREDREGSHRPGAVLRVRVPLTPQPDELDRRVG